MSATSTTPHPPHVRVFFTCGAYEEFPLESWDTLVEHRKHGADYVGADLFGAETYVEMTYVTRIARRTAAAIAAAAAVYGGAERASPAPPPEVEPRAHPAAPAGVALDVPCGAGCATAAFCDVFGCHAEPLLMPALTALAPFRCVP